LPDIKLLRSLTLRLWRFKTTLQPAILRGCCQCIPASLWRLKGVPQSFGEGTRDANRTSDNLRPLSGAYPALKIYSTRSGTRFPPGASATAEGVNFSLFSRNANRVELLLYDAADSAEPVQIISLDPDKNRSYFFWHVLVEGLPAGTHYTWRVDGGKELLDPWARAVTDSVWIRRKAISGAESGRNSIRGVVTTASALSPAKSPIVPGLNGAVIYELHVGGFTRHPSSCVPLRAA
jgi:pullulanase/glycogen debranching enzyme